VRKASYSLKDYPNLNVEVGGVYFLDGHSPSHQIIVTKVSPSSISYRYVRDVENERKGKRSDIMNQIARGSGYWVGHGKHGYDPKLFKGLSSALSGGKPYKEDWKKWLGKNVTDEEREDWRDLIVRGSVKTANDQLTDNDKVKVLVRDLALLTGAIAYAKRNIEKVKAKNFSDHIIQRFEDRLKESEAQRDQVLQCLNANHKGWQRVKDDPNENLKHLQRLYPTWDRNGKFHCDRTKTASMVVVGSRLRDSDIRAHEPTIIGWLAKGLASNQGIDVPTKKAVQSYRKIPGFNRNKLSTKFMLQELDDEATNWIDSNENLIDEGFDHYEGEDGGPFDPEVDEVPDGHEWVDGTHMIEEGLAPIMMYYMTTGKIPKKLVSNQLLSMFGYKKSSLKKMVMDLSRRPVVRKWYGILAKEVADFALPLLVNKEACVACVQILDALAPLNDIYMGLGMGGKTASVTKTASDLGDKEKIVLHVLTSKFIPSRFRPAEFRSQALGAYGPKNSLIQGLANKGLVRISGNKITVTKAGKKAFDPKAAQALYEANR